ncbi:hypothetical protein LX64_02640 [Chitinophaga skermanii]|uniref:Uncharacterized protein n=1 Tax=Chitinophaga skermanii TaxID=331697 RepID=A0A327QPA9_9BACT|nr:DUF6345 domain-containing protein [Chitinophaga skermanii]RAJ05482.1 hypothetical protein LX64_02640 [Chitinophaga skermanii]
MKTVLNTTRKAFCMLLLCCLGSTTLSHAADHEIGGYVDRAEDRFVRNVWNFIKNFDGWKTIGGNRYRYVQYYYAQPFMFTSSNNYYADRMDLSFVSAHGNYYLFETNQSTGTIVDLTTCPGYGDQANGGDMEFLIIESCSTVASAPERSDWWTPYMSIFKGLHQLVGFRTLSYSDNGIPNNFANKLKGNGGIWQSWFNAVNDERSWWRGSSYPGYASAIVYTTTENDRLSTNTADPYGANNMKTWWQH